MARKISITEIPDVMEDAVVFLVAATTLEWTSRVKKATPVDTGRLRNSWQTDIKPTTGTITNTRGNGRSCRNFSCCYYFGMDSQS